MTPKERVRGTDDRFDAFLRRTFPDATVAAISTTNNQVFKLVTKTEILSAKLMIDADIPVDYFVRCSEVLACSLPVQRVERVFRTVDGAAFDCIVSRFVDGYDLAAVLTTQAPTRVADTTVVDFLLDYTNACHDLPRLFEGFGVYKLDAPRFTTFASFLDSYARKYWSRVQPFFDPDIARLTDRWIDDGLSEASVTADGPRPVAIDSNLRNFVVAEDGELTLLNVPIVAWSSRAHAVGAIAAHLRPFPLRAIWLDRATAGWTSEERAMVPHFEAWTLLGILSFYAVRAPERPTEWRNWGATRSLRDDFAALVVDLSRAALSTKGSHGARD